MQRTSVEAYDGADASRWPSCEWSCPAFGPQAASSWRPIRRPAKWQHQKGTSWKNCTEAS